MSSQRRICFIFQCIFHVFSLRSKKKLLPQNLGVNWYIKEIVFDWVRGVEKKNLAFLNPCKTLASKILRPSEAAGHPQNDRFI